MPKTLSKDDPNLQKAVQRLARSHYLWTALFLSFGLLTQFAAAPRHVSSGLPFVVVGMACLLWSDPALLATVAVLFVLSDVPNLPHIPEMVPNRTNAQARWARGLAIAGMLCAIGSLFMTSVELVTLIRAGAELGGSLGAVAIGLGLGATFSPTGERPAALLGVGLGLIGYITAVFVLLRLPGV